MKIDSRHVKSGFYDQFSFYEDASLVYEAADFAVVSSHGKDSCDLWAKEVFLASCGDVTRYHKTYQKWFEKTKKKDAKRIINLEKQIAELQAQKRELEYVYS